MADTPMRSNPDEVRQGMPRRPERAIALGYETRQVRFGSAVWFVIAFALTAVVIHLFLWWFLGVLYRDNTRQDAALPPVTQRPTTLPAPLQPSPGHPAVPRQDLATMRRAEEERLSSSGPVPGEPGFVHIPVTQAMDLLLEHKELEKPAASATSQPYLRGEGP